MKIGFIGLGNMGGPMAANLAAAGHDVTGFDAAPAQVEGVSMVPTAQDAASGRDVVITMLPDGAILRQVAAEIIPSMAAGCGFIDCSTVDVDSARAVAADADAAGLLPVDAPVSGGVGGAVFAPEGGRRWRRTLHQRAANFLSSGRRWRRSFRRCWWAS